MKARLKWFLIVRCFSSNSRIFHSYSRDVTYYCRWRFANFKIAIKMNHLLLRVIRCLKLSSKVHVVRFASISLKVLIILACSIFCKIVTFDKFWSLGKPQSICTSSGHDFLMPNKTFVDIFIGLLQELNLYRYLKWFFSIKSQPWWT